MNKDLEYLKKLAEIDKEASVLEAEIGSIEEWLNDKLKAEVLAHEAVESVREEIKNSKLEIANNELVIAENNDKLAAIDKKMSAAKSEHEIRALDAENGLAKEKITFANEEIDKLEKAIENLKEKETAALERSEALSEEITKAKGEAADKIAAVKNSLKKIFDNKDKTAKHIDNKLLVFYEKIRKWAKDTSIVGVKKQACSGCFIRINDRVYSELLHSDDIITCPHCGRILFIEH